MQKYKAFISYSHKDKAWADWLHKRLETYKFPKNLSASNASALKPIFRDREELSVSSNLSSKIREALIDSECLIVICSEHSAKSEWVNKEITLFRSLKPNAEIFPVIISGEPNAEQQGLSLEKECFPIALRFSSPLAANGHSERIEPLAADLRKNKDGKQLGLVKLIAGMTSMSPDDLIQRDLQRARKRVIAVTTGASAIVLALSLLTVSTLIAREAAEQNAVIAQEQRMLAETRRDEAEGLIEFMLGDLRQELEPVGRLDLLTNVADRALEYYGQVDEDFSNCRSASGAARAKYLHTRIAVSQSEFPTARKSSDEALNLLEKMAEKCTHVSQFVTNHAHALQWSADLDTIIKDPNIEKGNTFDPRVLEKYKRARSNLHAFTGEGSSSLDMIIEKVDADILIGKYYMGTERIEDALSQFKSAVAKLEENYNQVQSKQMEITSHSYLMSDKYADILSWLSGAYEKLSRLEEATQALREARRIYTHLSIATESSGENWKARFDVVGSDYALARILYKQGNHVAALKTLKLGKKDIDQIVSQDPANQSWGELQNKIISSISALEKSPQPSP